MAPRANWKGYLRLSLVSCPIALYPASSLREKVGFNRINRKTGNRLKQQNVDSETGEVVQKPAHEPTKSSQSEAVEGLGHQVRSGGQIVADVLIERSSIIAIYASMKHDLLYSPRFGPRLGGRHQFLSNSPFPNALINHKRLQYNLISLFKCRPFIRMYQSVDSASLFRHSGVVRWVCKHAIYRCVPAAASMTRSAGACPGDPSSLPDGRARDRAWPHGARPAPTPR